MQACGERQQKYCHVPASFFDPAVLHDREEKLYSSVNHDEFIRDVRQLQHRAKCTNTTCVDFIRLFSKYIGDDKCPKGFAACDKELKKAAGVDCIVLNGCIQCNRHVYSHKDRRTHCPLCGFARYDDNGKANEVGSFYFCDHLVLRLI